MTFKKYSLLYALTISAVGAMNQSSASDPYQRPSVSYKTFKASGRVLQ